MIQAACLLAMLMSIGPLLNVAALPATNTLVRRMYNESPPESPRSNSSNEFQWYDRGAVDSGSTSLGVYDAQRDIESRLDRFNPYRNIRQHGSENDNSNNDDEAQAAGNDDEEGNEDGNDTESDATDSDREDDDDDGNDADDDGDDNYGADSESDKEEDLYRPYNGNNSDDDDY